jgi:hypothetical protein
MSWSGNCLIPKGTKAAEAIRMIDDMPITGNEDCPEERAESVEIAKNAVKVLLELDRIDDDSWLNTSAFNVNIGGHVNPNHCPRKGWADDYTNVQVSQNWSL